ncbi:MAG: TonB C-terminal domain-containing protein [Leptolyngbyaceae cyanobacterium CSU_1_4]|nr:TonB C-terminal domain-containing protein [Leptolyngbyaceae cyanobacterium CSU_1_4]
MNLAQYRLNTALKQRNRLRFCLAAAGMLHGGAIALMQPWSRPSPPSDPIQFRVIEQSNFSPTSAPLGSPPHSSAHPTETIAPASPFIKTTPLRATSPSASLPPPAAVKDDVWDQYLATLSRKIKQQWQVNRRTQPDRPIRIKFMVDRQGHMTNLTLIQSSQDATADQDALGAIQSAAPFAPLPIASPEDRLRVTFTFETSGYE